jgi:hypothetical protein
VGTILVTAEEFESKEADFSRADRRLFPHPGVMFVFVVDERVAAQIQWQARSKFTLIRPFD